MISPGFTHLFEMRSLVKSTSNVISPHLLIIASNMMKLLMLMTMTPSRFRSIDRWGHLASSKLTDHLMVGVFVTWLIFSTIFQIPIHHSSSWVEFNLFG